MFPKTRAAARVIEHPPERHVVLPPCLLQLRCHQGSVPDRFALFPFRYNEGKTPGLGTGAGLNPRLVGFIPEHVGVSLRYLRRRATQADRAATTFPPVRTTPPDLIAG
jgi:hypothetical protein